MGCATCGYGVDLEKLAAAKGSRDAALLAAVKEASAVQFRQDVQLGTISMSLEEALERLIAGDLSDESSDAAAQYLYALELLCNHLGERLDGQEHIKYLDDLGWETAAAELRLPLGLPAPDNFPAVSYLTADEVKADYERFKDEDTDDDDDPYVSEAREEFVWWLKQCADKNLALITFCY